MAENGRIYTAGVLTISTGGAEGWRQDTSGPEARTMLEQSGFSITHMQVVRDDVSAIVEVLQAWADLDRLPLIVTSGGTGLSPYDLTPEAMNLVVERPIPGMAEAMRIGTLAKTPMAMISRGVAGVRGQTLIVNLPGSPKGVRECLEIVTPVLHHAIALIRQDSTTH